MTQFWQSLTLPTMIKPILSLACVLIIALSACSQDGQTSSVNTDALLKVGVLEYEIVEIPLPGELGWEVMEYSGIDWYQDTLVLLPQYPQGISGSREGELYAIPGGVLRDFAEDPNIEIVPYAIPFDDAGLSTELAGFEGFEAIVFIGNTAYLTIETSGGDPMKGYIVMGAVDSDGENLRSITLDRDSLLELPMQNDSRNATYEALTSDGDSIYAFYEQNGTEQNDSPYAVRLTLDLSEVTHISIDSINFRVTDATLMDADGGFWIFNYFFPGDTHLAVGDDFLSNRYGLGETHLENRPIERLVKYQLTSSGFVIADQPPIYLKLLDQNVARNWEGLVAFDEIGFLLITDKFPGSILALLTLE